MKLINISFLIFGFLLASCASTPRQPYDFSAFEETNPKSILIIPPLNSSVEVNAPYIFLSTISKVVAEKGYYVFPVAVIDNYFKQNGLPTSNEMNAIKIEKLIEHLNPDAIMYVTINNWGQKFEVIQTRAVVDSHIKLVSSKTQKVIWQSNAFGQEAMSNYQADSFLELILGAIIGQVANKMVDNTQSLSYQANARAVNYGSSSLPNGPYFPVEEETP